jgi:hypothetical protein
MRRYEFYNRQPREFVADFIYPDNRIADLIRDERDGLARFVLYDPMASTMDPRIVWDPPRSLTSWTHRGRLL